MSESAPADAPRPPVSLGRHQLLFPIGHGGMSDVYLALVTSAGGVNKILVIKQLRASLLDEPEALSMFMDEARLAARLHHPNVVQTFEVGQEGPIPFMSMEFLDGQPLHRVLRRLGVGERSEGHEDHAPLTLGMRLRVITEMLEGLHYAHELRDYDGSAMQVVHRDVSPQNLFLTYDGQIKLVDFGIAKAADSITQTEGGGLKGKLAYMSPQQANGERLDRRTDVFAAGVMLWEMLSGRRLWAGVSQANVARRLVDHKLPDLAIEDVPGRLVEICRKALAPPLDERYASADAFRHELETFMDAEGLDASARAIGKRLARAFADEREDIRRRCDEELLRIVGNSGALPRASALWEGERASELTERTLESSDSQGAPPDEPTLNIGPEGRAGPAPNQPEPEPEPEPPTTEASTRQPSPGDAAPSTRERLPVWLGAAAILAAVVAVPLWMRADADERAAAAASPEDSRDAAPAEVPVEPEGAGEAKLAAAEPGDCEAEHKPVVELSGEIEGDAALSCDRDYLLRFHTRVAPGATLTIEAGTTIRGDGETKGTLIVQPGARLVAEGTAERPIVFTSNRPAGEREPGDWGGVILLGEAPINLRDAEGRAITGHVEGITGGGEYGGQDPEDDSGVLRYVRIEYPGIELAPGNEINGLTLAGVGRGTVLDHVQVRETSDDCYEFFGGTVDGRHLICDHPGDDGFDFDHGYQGRLQFLLVRDAEADGDTSNAFEFDNDPNGTPAEPRTRPQIWNATLCGSPGGAGPSYALLVRRAASPVLGNLIVSGFDHALDRRDASTQIELRGLALIDQEPAEIDERDDDRGFDEAAWLAAPARASTTDAPDFPGCAAPPAGGLVPRAAIAAPAESAPPDDGFFAADAGWLGAFSSEDWSVGAWTQWRD